MKLSVALNIFWCLALNCIVASSKELNNVIMVSFDGFRHDYLDMVKARGGKTPNFDSLIQNGVKAKYMVNSFITKTFPNHYTLVTGMHEESHGVVSNNMFDPKYNETFTLAMSDSPHPELNKWFTNDTTDPLGPEPIWVTNQKSQDGKVRRSGAVMWPGSTAEVHGHLPTRLLSYNRTVKNETRVDQLISWFTDQREPINLGLLYFNEPDHTGHAFGPNSLQIFNTIVALDGIVGYLVQQLKDHDLFDKTNLIITSDHGMDEITNITYISDYVNSTVYQAFGSTPVLSVFPNEGQNETELYLLFKKLAHVTVYRKEEIPRHFFYTYNRRILPLLLVADDGWQMCQESPCDLTRGNHGYSNLHDHMHPIFLAHGPDFKEKLVAPAFNNYDVYPLLCRLLRLTPAPHNGSLDVVSTFLREENREDWWLTLTGITFVCAVGFAALVSSIVCLAALRVYRSSSRRVRLRRAENKPQPDVGYRPVGEEDNQLLGSGDESDI